MKTKTFVRIILTIAILVITSFVFIVFASIAETSHNISGESRDNAMIRGFLTIGVGVTPIVVVWIPWRQIIKRQG